MAAWLAVEARPPVAGESYWSEVPSPVAGPLDGPPLVEVPSPVAGSPVAGWLLPSWLQLTTPLAEVPSQLPTPLAEVHSPLARSPVAGGWLLAASLPVAVAVVVSPVAGSLASR